MVKNYILSLFVMCVFVPTIAQNSINFDVTSTVGTGWVGYMNVSNLPAPFGDGVYQFGSGWGPADLVAIVDTGSNTVTLKPNRIGDPDPYWQSGNLTGNKYMDATFYLEDDSLAGTAFSFNGNVVSNTINSTGLDVPLEYEAFIKVYAPDYSSFTEFTYSMAITGDFTINVSATDSAPGNHVQYGFTVRGPNIGLDTSFDAQYDALGSIVVGENTTLSVGTQHLQDIRLYPNPSQENWHLKSSIIVSLIEVFDVFGKQLLVLKPNALQTSINAASLPQGIYLAKIHCGSKVETFKLIKK